MPPSGHNPTLSLPPGDEASNWMSSSLSPEGS